MDGIWVGWGIENLMVLINYFFYLRKSSAGPTISAWVSSTSSRIPASRRGVVFAWKGWTFAAGSNRLQYLPYSQCERADVTLRRILRDDLMAHLAAVFTTILLSQPWDAQLPDARDWVEVNLDNPIIRFQHWNNPIIQQFNNQIPETG